MSALDTHKIAMGQKLPNLSDLEIGEDLIDRFAERYRTDAKLRARCAAEGAARALAELGMSTPGGAEARIVENTDEITWVVFPRDPNAPLSDDIAGFGRRRGGGSPLMRQHGEHLRHLSEHGCLFQQRQLALLRMTAPGAAAPGGSAAPRSPRRRYR